LCVYIKVFYLKYVVIWKAQWKINTAMHENGSEKKLKGL